ncbi:MAG: hypothetical protein NC548_60650 [Lachnospiraceae bacterium]|nr:hypothetical protein [Lachnospiraceae bacterium]
MSKWFTDVKDVETLRKRYKELLKTHHPDNGGDEETMKEINAEYDRISARMSRESKPSEESTADDSKAENEAFKAVINGIININADVEIIGSWVWVHGGYEYRELLKSIGFRYAPRKKCWCWHFGEYRRHHKGEVSLDEIRLKYGSQTVNRKSKQCALN